MFELFRANLEPPARCKLKYHSIFPPNFIISFGEQIPHFVLYPVANLFNGAKLRC